MKITETQLRKMIREALILEGAKRPEDLPPGAYVLVRHGDFGGSVSYKYEVRRAKPPVVGMVTWQSQPFKPNTVNVASADSGWGPMLYDIAIEISGERGLMSDRMEVSGEARAVWNHYMNRRGDIEKVQYDNDENELTPIYDDNVNQDVAESDPGAKPWWRSSLSKGYVSSGTPVIDRLRALGKIKFEGYGEDT
jgi:hypothetical protein